MLIAFEGPDGVGKSTSARLLSHNGTPIYNATKENHKGARRELEQGSSAFGFGQDLVQTFDRIDWLTHMVYRLAMPNKEWNDERVRTVFAMPDTHLVIKLHRMDYDGNFFGAPPIQHAEDEGYKLDQLLKVNQAYFWFLQYFQGINHAWEYSLFRSLTAVDVWFTLRSWSSLYPSSSACWMGGAPKKLPS